MCSNTTSVSPVLYPSVPTYIHLYPSVSLQLTLTLPLGSPIAALSLSGPDPASVAAVFDATLRANAASCATTMQVS